MFNLQKAWRVELLLKVADTTLPTINQVVLK